MKRDFIVIASLDEETTQIMKIQAENYDVACHLAEIFAGDGAYIALNQSQAEKIVEELRYSLNS